MRVHTKEANAAKGGSQAARVAIAVATDSPSIAILVFSLRFDMGLAFIGGTPTELVRCAL
jgi:hypothetical protein